MKKKLKGAFGYIQGAALTGSYTAFPFKKVTDVQITTQLADPFTQAPIDFTTKSTQLYNPSLEDLEDMMDVLAAKRALAESDERISYEEICQKYGFEA